VSTAKQANDGESLETQRENIQLHARMLKKTVDRVFEERGVSAASRSTNGPKAKGS